MLGTWKMIHFLLNCSLFGKYINLWLRIRNLPPRSSDPACESRNCRILSIVDAQSFFKRPWLGKSGGELKRFESCFSKNHHHYHHYPSSWSRSSESESESESWSPPSSPSSSCPRCLWNTSIHLKNVPAPRSNNMSILPTTPGPAMARHLCSKAKQRFYPPPLEFPIETSTFVAKQDLLPTKPRVTWV